MADDYLSTMRASAQEPDSELDALMRGEAMRDQARLAGTATLTMGVNPDQVANAKKAAAFLGVPSAAAMAAPADIERQARIKKLDVDTAQAPTLRSRYTDADFARLAHDDSGVLASVERAVRGFLNPPRIQRAPAAVMSSAEFSSEVRALMDRQGLDADTARALLLQQTSIDNGPLMGPVRGPKPTAANIFRGAFSLDQFRATNEAMGLAATDALGLDNTQAIRRYQVARARVDNKRPEFETATGAGLYSGLESTVRNAPGIALSILSGNPAPGLAMAGFQEGIDTYGTVRERGGTPGQAALAGGLSGTVEVGTEMLPMSFLVKKLGRAGAGEFLKGLLAREIPGEQLATVLQDAIDTAIANPDKTWGDFARERPGAAYQTLLATLVQTGIMGSANAVATRAAGRQDGIARAEEAAARAQEFAAVVEQSKLKARDVGAFQEFVAGVAQDGEGPAEFFIDAQQLANSLQQGALTAEEFAAIAPTVAAQLEAARFVPGADIRVPVAEFAAVPTEVCAALLDHLRERPDAMSRAEAQEFIAQEGQRIEQDVQQALAERDREQAFRQDVENTRDYFQAQLQAVGKFRPEVNRAYATMLGNFYATQAQRAGMPVDEFLDRYRLRITAKDGAGAQQLEQPQFSQGQQASQQTADAMRAELQQRFPGVAEALESSGVLRLWDNLDAYNAAAGEAQLSEDYRGAQGMYLGGTAHLFGDGVAPGNVVPVFLHEVGEHASMKDMLGERYPDLVRRAYQLVKEGDVIAQAAIMRIPDDTPRKFYDSEMVAYLIEEAAGRQQEAGEGLKAWLDEAVAAIRAWLYQKGVTLELSAQDVAALAVRAVEWQAQQETPAQRGTTEAMASRKDVAGTNQGGRPAGDEKRGASYNQDLDTFWIKKAKEELGDSDLPDAQYHQAVAEYANARRVEELLEKMGWKRRGSSNVSASSYFEKTIYPEEDPDGDGLTYEVRVTDHDDFRPADDSIERRFQINFRDGAPPWSDVDIGPELSSAEVLNRLQAILPNEPTASESPDARFSKAPQTDSEAFRRWFGDSKVVDAEGKPLVVYHGTDADFSVFDREKSGKGPSKLGFWFTDMADFAENFGGTLMPAYVTLKNPKRLTAAQWDSIRMKHGGDAAFFAKMRDDLIAQGFDGVVVPGGVDKVGKFEVKTPAVYAAFNSEQIKSVNNRGTFDPKDPNILNQGPRGTLSFGNDISAVPSIIALLEGADLSTFLHESGHLFLEVQADLASRIAGQPREGASVSDSERQIVADMDAILKWMGIAETPERNRLDTWASMTLEEKREHHEKWARGFERYLMEGNAPSQELAGLFSKFRAWLVSVYKALAGLNVDLTDEVRQVMDRMLATDEAIAEAMSAREMGPLFQSPEQAGMTPEEYAAYQGLTAKQTEEAQSQLEARLMKDMRWLSRARGKALKEAQAVVDDLRREVRAEIRGEVLASPVYRAWGFLTGKMDRVQGEKTGKVGEEHENLFAAIGRLGGLDAAQVKSQWGVDTRNDDLKSGLFGQPVVRKTGGLSIDAMAERLVEAGYLLPDADGKADLAKFEALFDDQLRGIDRYSIRKDYAAAQGEQQAEALDLPPSASGRLNTDALRRMYGEQQDAKWRLLSERRMTSPTGIDPEVVAVTFGFSSADHLVNDLVRAQPPEMVIEEMTDRAMLERHGDIASPEALARAADEAVYNEMRARVVATELKALEKATTLRERAGKRSTVDAMARAAKDYAYQIIARQRVRDLRPGQYAAAQARSARLAAQALGTSTEEAAMHKRNELINGYAARAAMDAQEEVRALQRYFRRFDKRSPTIDPGYLDQIEQLLERFDFRPASLKEIDRRKSFRAWYDEQVEQGNAPDVPDDLLDDSARRSYKDMTVEEMRGLRDTVKQIEHQGRLKKKLLLARDARDFDAIAKEVEDSIIEHGGDKRPVELEGPNPVTDWFAGAWAAHRKLASLIRQMDGNRDDGPLWRFMGQAMNERSTMEDVMLEKATEKLAELYAPMTKLRGGLTGYRSKVFIPEINASLTRGGRLAVALNWGNEANRQRIMDGDRWSVDQVQAVLKTLAREELEFVNQVWEFLDSYWPEIAAKEKRLTGIEPPKVEALPFNVLLPDGSEVAMRGGYYPLKYDTQRSDRADQHEAAQVAKEMMQGVFTKATTRRGHTKERLKEVKRAVRKDLNVITQHVTQVVHDLAWHEFLIDTNKLLGDDRIAGAIRDHYGPKVLKTMRDDILGIATADVVPQTDVDKALLLLRGNVTRATMGASLTTAFLQPFGLTQSMVRIGGRHVLRGAARWGGDAMRMESTISWINERSDFMRLRAKTFNRELREIRGTVAGKSKVAQAVDAGLFVLMRKMQLVADVPTWLGQYEKSRAEGLAEADAIAMADRAVLESQGGGATKDLAEVQRKHPMLTQFYSYFSVTLNLAAEQTAAADFKNPRALAGWLGDMALLLVIPAILPSFILYALRGGDDDDEKGMAKRMLEWQASYLLGMVVGARELTGAVSGFDYAGPPVGRAIADLGKAGKQTAQGEVDEPLVKSYVNLLGSVFGVPTTQALRSWNGWKAWDEGKEGAGPQSVLFGPPPKD